MKLRLECWELGPFSIWSFWDNERLKVIQLKLFFYRPQAWAQHSANWQRESGSMGWAILEWSGVSSETAGWVSLGKSRALGFINGNFVIIILIKRFKRRNGNISDFTFSLTAFRVFSWGRQRRELLKRYCLLFLQGALWEESSRARKDHSRSTQEREKMEWTNKAGRKETHKVCYYLSYYPSKLVCSHPLLDWIGHAELSLMMEEKRVFSGQEEILKIMGRLSADY